MALSASRGHDSQNQWDGGLSEAGSTGPMTHVLDGTGAVSVRMPDKAFLTDGQFVGSGADLKIELPDGRAVVVEGYFQGTQPPDLVGPDGGAVLSPALVQSFLGSLAPGQYAQAAPSAEASPIGRVDDLEGQATAVRTDGSRVSLEKGDPVFQGDVIETGGDASAVRLVFADKTMFALGPDARLALDEMVFDSANQEGSVQFSILKGVFIFASGQIAKTDNTDMTVTTPVATIGIRGTDVAGRVADGDSQFTIIDGAIEVTNRAGSVALDSRGETTDVASIDTPPSPPYILTPTEYAEAYEVVVGIASEYFGGGAPGGGELPDDGGGHPGEQRGHLEQDPDGATADFDSDGGPTILARTFGGDTGVLFGSTGSSGEAWSDSTADADLTAGETSDGDNDGAGFGGSSDGGSTDDDVFGSDALWLAQGDDGETVSQTDTTQTDTTTATTSSSPDEDPLLGLASDLTLDGGTSSSDTIDFSASGDPSFGAASSPLRVLPENQTPGWTNVRWDADGGSQSADTDFYAPPPVSASSKQIAAEDDAFDDAFENAFEELAVLTARSTAADQEGPSDEHGVPGGVTPEGITLVVSHKSINGNFEDVSDGHVLPDLGPGSSVTISGADLGLTGLAGTAEISLMRDAVDSVDVSLDSVWNSIPNIRVVSEMAGTVDVSKFVRADVQLGDGGDSNVTIDGAKQGLVATGAGDDLISIEASSNGFAGAATFDLRTGAGDDMLVFNAPADGNLSLAFDGGEGFDTLWLAGPGTEFDLTGGDYNLTGIERLVVSGDADVSTILSADVVAAITGDFNELTASANTMVIDGDAGDSIDLGAGWSAGGAMEIDGSGYTIYEHADGVRIVADNDISVA